MNGPYGAIEKSDELDQTYPFDDKPRKCSR